MTTVDHKFHKVIMTTSSKYYEKQVSIDNLRYVEAVRQSASYILNNYEPLNVDGLVTHMFARGHLTQGDYQYINETVHTRDKILQLLGLIIGTDCRNARQAFLDIVEKFSEDDHQHDVVETLRTNLAEASQIKDCLVPEQCPHELITHLHNRIQNEFMLVTPMEILNSLRSIKEKMQPLNYARDSPACSKTHQDNDHRKIKLSGVDAKTSALMNACLNENENQVKWLLEYPNDVEIINLKNEKGQTALMIASERNNCSIVKILLNCETIDVNLKDTYGRTALTYCVLDGSLAILAELLSCEDLDVNATDHKGLSTSWYAYGLTTVLELSSQLRVHNVRWALEHLWQQTISRIKDQHENLDWDRISEIIRQLRLHEATDRKCLLKSALLVGREAIVVDILKCEPAEICSDSLVDYIYNAVLSVRPGMLQTLVDNAQIRFDTLPFNHRNEIANLVLNMNNAETSTTMLKLCKNCLDFKTKKIVMTIQTLDVDIAGDILTCYNVSNFNTRDDKGNTVFMIVCNYCSSALVSALLHIDGINFTAQNAQDETAVMLACNNWFTDVPLILLKSGKFDINKCDRFGMTILMHACESNNCKVVEYLVNCANVNANSRNNNGSTSLMLACQFSSLRVVTLLLRISDINTNNHDGETALMFACKRGNTEILDRLLRVDGICVNATDRRDMTSLMWACMQSSGEIVSLLLCLSEMNINARNVVGWTALMVASRWSNSDVVKSLLSQCQLDIDSKDSIGQSSFLWACRWGNLDAVTALLNESYVDVNATDVTGNTAFMWACMNGYTDVVRTLLRHCHVDANVSNKDGENALMWACRWGHAAIVTLLLQLRNIDANTTNNYDQTALMLASTSDNTDIVEILLSLSNIDVNDTNYMGETALIIACKNGNVGVSSLIMNHTNVDTSLRDHTGRTAYMWDQDMCMKKYHSGDVS